MRAVGLFTRAPAAAVSAVSGHDPYARGAYYHASPCSSSSCFLAPSCNQDTGFRAECGGGLRRREMLSADQELSDFRQSAKARARCCSGTDRA